MSAAPDPKDLRACSTLLNTLHAEYQGAFVRQVVLAKLGSSAHDESDVPGLQARLQRIGEWGSRLWRREPLLLADGSSPNEEELRLALRWLGELAGRLEEVGRALEAALDAIEGHSHDGRAVPEAALVAAAQSWAAYAWENELRGAVQFGEALDDAEIADRARERLPAATQALQVAHHHLQRLETERPPGCDLLGELHRSCSHLPGLFAAKTEAARGLWTQLHELRSKGADASPGPD